MSVPHFACRAKGANRIFERHALNRAIYDAPAATGTGPVGLSRHQPGKSFLPHRRQNFAHGLGKRAGYQIQPSVGVDGEFLQDAGFHGFVDRFALSNAHAVFSREGGVSAKIPEPLP